MDLTTEKTLKLSDFLKETPAAGEYGESPKQDTQDISPDFCGMDSPQARSLQTWFLLDKDTGSQCGILSNNF